ncbi:hypothetical protein AYO20_07722 [Fonsecaea nubica]|uniref:Aminoglycoside phosphotransferase domain-containing protein n=1 Tax=Fonsecaea nubica TaxID=856822 RepID=A0A178CTJ4_9EURO|nr:hypothetical protein AYO20_07722 [Fonsecaea nubica]OAL32766.1 hypothetical protein AYO20_07722 [Fonsecaea nubica]
MASKQSLETPPDERKSDAANLNERLFKKMKKAVDSNPEVDLLSLFPKEYSERLARLASSPKRDRINPRDKGVTSLENVLPKQDNQRVSTIHDDIRYLLSAGDVQIMDQPSHSVQELIKSKMEVRNASPAIETEPQQFSMALIRLIQEGEIVSTGPVASRRMVVKCGVDTIAKLVWGLEEYTDYTTLQYLLEHKPSIPAPRPLGLVRMGWVTIFFMSYLSGPTLEAVWADLGTDEKASVRDQLDVIFRDLRKMEFPNGMSLGGVGGEGCKDLRRHLRRSTTPIFDVKEFENFQFSNPNYGSKIFIDFLRAFAPQSSRQIVFTHGDLRPANVIVEVTQDRRCIVTGVIDWEDSGFYPEYYEATNCLATDQVWDWFQFLPPCISPHTYPVEWLRDYVWGRHLE